VCGKIYTTKQSTTEKYLEIIMPFPLALAAGPAMKLLTSAPGIELAKAGLEKLTGGDKKEAPEGKESEKKDCQF